MSTKFNPILQVFISPCCIEKALILFYLSCLTNAFYTAGGTNAPPLYLTHTAEVTKAPNLACGLFIKFFEEKLVSR